MKTQHGAAMVEFAIIALLFFIILFGIIEFGRAFFTYNTLVEATRRGARVAAVCPVTDNGQKIVQNITVFNDPNPSVQNPGLLGLSPNNNVVVSYLDEGMSPVVNPATAYDSIFFVRVSIQNVSNINLIIPSLSISIPVPPVVTTLPSESLGRTTVDNPTTGSPIRCCFNVCS